MRLAQWLTDFRKLHAKARGGALDGPERTSYLAAREELARALLAAQHVQAKRGQPARAALRVARAVQAELSFATSGKVRALTLDLSVGGFGALLAHAPATGEKVRFSLRLPGGVFVEGAARAVGVAPNAGSARVAFAFEGLSPEDLEQIELLVFDTVLEQMKLDPR
jgi:c-di-GMP-binding flagellar brake protein YcgR